MLRGKEEEGVYLRRRKERKIKFKVKKRKEKQKRKSFWLVLFVFWIF